MAVFPDKVMANAVMDRLAHNAHQIVLKGESHRKTKGLKADALSTTNQTEETTAHPTTRVGNHLTAKLGNEVDLESILSSQLSRNS